MVDTLSIQFEETDSKEVYSARLGDGPKAHVATSKVGTHAIIIEHTEVPDAYRGQGVGAALIAHVVDQTRSKGQKIIPLCPFAAAQFRKHPEWADVWSGHAPKPS